MAKKTKSVIQVSRSMSKKGKLKGKNKKETRVLKGLCPHHKLNKHGKVKPSIISNDGQYGICTMCGAKFPISFYSNDTIYDRVDDMKEMNNQNKFTSVAINSGDQTIDYFAQFGVMLESYAKTTKKLRNVAQKQDNVKSKKSHRGKGSSQYGSWGQR